MKTLLTALALFALPLLAVAFGGTGLEAERRQAPIFGFADAIEAGTFEEHSGGSGY